MWSPDTLIDHYDSLIAECDATEKAIEDEVVLYVGKQALAGIRERLIAEAEANAGKRAEYAAKREAALAEKERRTRREQRLEQFIAKAAQQSDTLDDLTPDQRRDILLDLHPTVAIGRPRDPKNLRISVLFELSADAAAHAFAPGEVFPQGNWKDKDGNHYWSGAYEGWPPASSVEVDANGEPYVDFSNIPDDDLDTNGGAVVESSQPPAAPNSPAKLPSDSSTVYE